MIAQQVAILVDQISMQAGIDISTAIFILPVELLESGAVPTPPGVLVDVLRLTGAAETTADDLAHVIEADPVLTGKLLGTVNSSLYSLNSEIHSISHALMLLGFKTVRSLALGVSVAGETPDPAECEGFDVGRYWQHSLMTSLIARGLASLKHRKLTEDAFTVGLIGNLGRIVLASALPQRYTAALRATPWPDTIGEISVLGYDSAFVTAGVLEQWGLPESICLAARHIRDTGLLPSDCPSDVRLVAELVHAADAAANDLLEADGSTDLASLAETIDRDLDLDHESVGILLEDISTQMGQLGELIGNNLQIGASPAQLIAQAQNALQAAVV